MHIVHGRPAMFEDGQIVYGIKKFPYSGLCSSLADIKKQQKESLKYRQENFGDASEMDYKHMVIYPNK